MDITSLTNPEVKHIIKLKQAKYRKQYKQTFAQGIRTCQTLLHSQHIKLQSLYVTLQTAQAHEWIAHYPHKVVSDAVMEKLNTQTTSPGLIGVFSIPECKIPKDVPATSVVLYDLHNPGNIGAIIRSAVAFGCTTIFTIKGADPFQPKVLQASVGTIGYAQIIPIQWHTLYAYQTAQTIQLCALTPRHGQSPSQISMHHNLSLVIGNEAHGIPDHIAKQCALQLTIPMPGPVESLNASIAASLGLFCITKQS